MPYVPRPVAQQALPQGGVNQRAVARQVEAHDLWHEKTAEALEHMSSMIALLPDPSPYAPPPHRPPAPPPPPPPPPHVTNSNTFLMS